MWSCGGRYGKSQIATRITASPTNYEENLKCRIILYHIRRYFTAARFSLFADCEKRPSDPLSPSVQDVQQFYCPISGERGAQLIVKAENGNHTEATASRSGDMYVS